MKGVSMKQIMIKRLAALLSVKSLVTLILTGVFAYLAVMGKIEQDFMTIYAMIIAFYFSVQSQKEQTADKESKEGKESGNGTGK